MEYISIFFFSQWEFLAGLERFTDARFLKMPDIWALLSFLPFMIAARLLTLRALLLTTVLLGLSMTLLGYFSGMYDLSIWLPFWFIQLRSFVQISVAVVMMGVIPVRVRKDDATAREMSWLGQGIWIFVAWAALFFAPHINWASMAIAGDAAKYAAVPEMMVSVAAGTLTAMALLLISPTVIGFLLSVFPSLALRRTVLVVLALPWVWQIPQMLRYAEIHFLFSSLWR